MAYAIAVLLGWTVPATREDGTSIEPWEISHYVLYRGDREYAQTTESHYDVGDHGVFTVRAVDVRGGVSGSSNGVRVKKRDLR